MNAPIAEQDWEWLTSQPRLLRTWDMNREGSTAAIMLSTLKFAEAGDDALIVPLELSLGELRHHVQWCQIAGNVLETAKQSQDHFFHLEHRIRELDNHIRKLEEMMLRRGVDPPPKPKLKKRPTFENESPF